MNVNTRTAYLAFVIVMTIISFTSIQHMIIMKKNQLSGYTLLIAGQDVRQVRLANRLSKYGIHTSDVTKITNLAHHDYILPSLYSADSLDSDERKSYQGYEAVNEHIRMVTDDIMNCRNGMISLAIIIAYVAFCVIFTDVLYFGLMVYPVIIIYCCSILTRMCISCASRDSIISTISLFGIFIVAIIGIMVYWFGFKVRIMSHILVILGMLAPIMSIVNITLNPKLCYACIVSGFCCYACSHIPPKKYVTGKLGLAKIPSLVIFLFFVISIFCVRAFSVEPIAQHDFDYLGESSVSLDLNDIVTPYQCVVITNPFCGACRKAIQGLKNLNISYVTVPFCSVANSSRCFQPKGTFVSTPTILVFDNNKKVVFQSFGWPIGDDLLNKLKLLAKSTGR